MTRTIAKAASFSSSRRKSTKPKKRCNRALQEIKYYQKSTNLLIPKVPFMRLVKQILDELTTDFGFRWKEDAINALHEMAEVYIIQLFEDTNIVALNSKRVTIKVQDMQLVRRLRGYSDIANW